jgi:hypothetical protein
VQGGFEILELKSRKIARMTLETNESIAGIPKTSEEIAFLDK